MGSDALTCISRFESSYVQGLCKLDDADIPPVVSSACSAIFISLGPIHVARARYHKLCVGILGEVDETFVGPACR